MHTIRESQLVPMSYTAHLRARPLRSYHGVDLTKLRSLMSWADCY